MTDSRGVTYISQPASYDATKKLLICNDVAVVAKHGHKLESTKTVDFGLGRRTIEFDPESRRPPMVMFLA